MKQEKDSSLEPYKVKRAVAIKYEPGDRSAPVLVAKGKGQIAERILESAKQNDIPVQEDSSLVEVLSKLDIDQEIPAELYTLVAEILSFVYRSDRKARDMAHE